MQNITGTQADQIAREFKQTIATKIAKEWFTMHGNVGFEQDFSANV
jgi:hypothetical protein